MSILIKGIDIPRDIDFVEITTYKNGIPQMTIGKGRDDAIQIDRPHGRLIDESDLTDELTELNDLNLENIAPTILEAEE